MSKISLRTIVSTVLGASALVVACSSVSTGGSGSACQNDYGGRWKFSGSCTSTTCDVTQSGCSLTVRCDDGTQGSGTVSGASATVSGLLGSGDSGSCTVAFGTSKSLSMQCTSSRSTQPCTSTATCEKGSCGDPFPTGGSGSGTVPCQQKAGADTDKECEGQLGKPRKLDCDAADTAKAVAAGCTPVSSGASDVCCPLTVSGTTSSTSSCSSTSSTSPGGTDAAPAVTCLPYDPKLFGPVAGTGPFCSGAPTAVSNHCAFGEKCCQDLAAGTKTCGATCPAGTAITACFNPTECPQGMVCCGKGTPDTTACSYLTIRSYTGSICSASCRTGEFTACGAAGDCGGGTTCTPSFVLDPTGTKALSLPISLCR